MSFEQMSAPGREPEITASQWETADDMIELLGLSEAEVGTNMMVMGQTASVRYGLARCGHHMEGMTPEQVRAFISAGIEAAQAGDARRV